MNTADTPKSKICFPFHYGTLPSSSASNIQNPKFYIVCQSTIQNQ